MGIIVSFHPTSVVNSDREGQLRLPSQQMAFSASARSWHLKAGDTLLLAACCALTFCGELIMLASIAAIANPSLRPSGVAVASVLLLRLVCLACNIIHGLATTIRNRNSIIDASLSATPLATAFIAHLHPRIFVALAAFKQSRPAASGTSVYELAMLVCFALSGEVLLLASVMSDLHPALLSASAVWQVLLTLLCAAIVDAVFLTFHVMSALFHRILNLSWTTKHKFCPSCDR